MVDICFPKALLIRAKAQMEAAFFPSSTCESCDVVKSETFEIEIKNRTGRVEKRWLYVVHRGGQPSENVSGNSSGNSNSSEQTQGAAPIELTLLTSRRVSDFLEVRAPDMDNSYE